MHDKSLLWAHFAHDKATHGAPKQDVLPRPTKTRWPETALCPVGGMV